MYNFKEIEDQSQKLWREKRIFEAQLDSSKPKYYVLDMFPYPSGDGLHVGHVKLYTATDVISHYYRLKGYNILHPTGWDAFGLPAENYAIKVKKNPSEVVKKNVAIFKRQMQDLGFSYDWTREINTTDPQYYKWTQWIFIKMFEKGLAYQAETQINFCPSCKTGLANEEVVSGACERCHTQVIKKNLKQWILKITDYADRLLEDLKDLDWPKPIKEMQENWIGRSEGTQIFFPINSDRKYNYILIPGYKENSKDAFFPNLKKILEEHGHSVFLEDLPNIDDPSEQEQIDFIVSRNTFSSDTIVIGHSLGAVLAMKLLQKVNQPIESLILIAAAINPNFPGVKERPYWNKFSWEIDYKRIISLTNRRVVISDTRESKGAQHESLRQDYLRLLSTQLSAELNEIESEKEHFLSSNETGVLNILRNDISVYTTRADTLYGCTYLVVAPEHEIIEKYKDKISNYTKVKEYINSVKNKTELERTDLGKNKTGIIIEGITVTNPVNGKRVPVFVADYVLGHYGTGAVMAVPAHDERDFEFAKKYSIEIKWVIGPVENQENAFVDYGILENSEEFSGLESRDAIIKITEKLKKNDAGDFTVNYKLRDWIFSRQRYWGEPIPIVHCTKCGPVAVEVKNLPVELPYLENYEPTGTGESPLAKVEDWVNTTCPSCGGPAKRETNTMPNWAGSCWYYLRFADPDNQTDLISKEADQYFAPVDFYLGGAEHAVLHLLYARFWHKFLYDTGVVKDKEPFKKLQNVGLILAPDRQKMSKSRGNVINPDDAVKSHGTDALRMYEMFIGPFDQPAVWSQSGITGTHKFLEKIFNSFNVSSSESEDVQQKLNSLVSRITDKIEKTLFNTAISDFMKFSNDVDLSSMSKRQWETFLIILSPFAPHLCEYLNFKTDRNSIFTKSWPEPTETLLKGTSTYVVQINGKKRGLVEMQADLEKNEVLGRIYEVENISALLKDVAVKNIIFVKDKLVNFVV